MDYDIVLPTVESKEDESKPEKIVDLPSFPRFSENQPVLVETHLPTPAVVM
jgi:hypothetical protein